MGLLIIKRSYIKKRTDFLKLKLLMENFMARRVVSDLLHEDSNGKLKVENFLDSYVNGENVNGMGRIKTYMLARILEVLRESLGVPKDKFKEELIHPNIRRTIIAGLLTLQKCGLHLPQKFAVPLMVVWNLTYTCNLRCKHCYEDAGVLRDKDLSRDELSLDEKLAVVDQIADSNIPTLSFSGGEPLMSKHFWEVAERASKRGLYLSINTNGTFITPEVAQGLADLDFAYVAVSLDGPTAEIHDEFRGVAGSWDKSIEGIKNMVATGIDTVLSVTVTQYNHRYLRAMFKLANDLGMRKVMVYNFIPTGRGKEIMALDMTPEMREEILNQMYEYSKAGGSLCSTAPQLGRICKEQGEPGLVPLAHTGSGRAKDLAILADLIGGCGVGRAYCALQPDGRMTPCVYMPDVTVGHIRENRILDVWENSPLIQSLGDRSDLKGSCGECEYREVCGGCRARAWAYFRDFKAPDPGCIKNLAYYMEFKKKEAAGVH